jgi:hypothetical protein
MFFFTHSYKGNYIVLYSSRKIEFSGPHLSLVAFYIGIGDVVV